MPPRPLSRRRAALAAAVLALAPARGGAQPSTRADSLPLHLFAYDRSAPLELSDSVIGSRDGVAIHAVSFVSPRGGRATGRLFVPPGAGPFAGVVLAHGMPGSAEAFTGRGVYIARHGAVVIAIDAPWARRGGPPLSFTPADSADQVQLIVDLQRAVDVLLARPDVDPERLAYVGRSYGGAMGALLAGVERRLKTYVLAVADAGLVAHMVEGSGEDPPQGAPEEQWRRWLAAMKPIEPVRFVGRAAPASLFFQSALRDRAVARDDAEAVQTAASEPRTVKWYDTDHPLNAEAHVDQLRWLHEHVGTTAPGPRDQAGPEIPPPPAPRRRP
ncbi:MAG TPA: prolyl oligopeptidase family serine peptidase [Longimicrobium sp.]